MDILLGMICCILIFSLVSLRIVNEIKRIKYIESFDLYLSVLDFHMKKAYDIIYKDKLMIYSVEATKVSESQFNTYSKDFVTLVLLFIGPKFQKEFSNMYGDEETFFFNLIDYFNSRYESDEVRETATNELIDKDQTG